MQHIEKEIRLYLSATFLFGKDCDSLSTTTSLLADGIIDSTGVLELAGFLERTFDLRVEDEDLVPDNFDSIGSLVAFVLRKAPGLDNAELGAVQVERRVA